MPGESANRGVNRTKPDQWKADILQSVDMYNAWFMEFAPIAYRETRVQTTKDVESTLQTPEALVLSRNAPARALHLYVYGAGTG